MDLFDNHDKQSLPHWGLEPNELVTKLPLILKTGTVLDIGAGDGRDSVFLAKSGYTVTALESSAHAIHKIQQMVKIMDTSLQTIQADITSYSYTQDFDVILCMHVLHFLSEDHVQSSIQAMQKHTRIGGINVLSVFTDQNPSKQFSYLFKQGQLKEFYKHWKIREYEEFQVPPQLSNNLPQRHATAHLIAQKMS